MIPLLLALVAPGGTALAGDLYVNDVHVNPVDLQGMTLEDVDVTIDATGTIRIAAPGYKIQVVNPTPISEPGPAAAQADGAKSEGYYPPGAYGNAYGSQGPPPAKPKAAGLAPLDPNVPAATWWLVTEDGGTTGHSIEVFINGRLAQTIKSGEPQRIVDVGKHVKVGANTVTIKSTTTAPTGQSLYVYVGTGNDRSGTVVLDEPTVQYGLGTTRTGPHEKTYTFDYAP